MISLVFLDDRDRFVFEPGASSVEDRLFLLRRFKEEGMDVAVAAMPFLPFINDGGDYMEHLFSKLSTLQVSHVIPGVLTLRPGRQKEHFLEVLKNSYPNLLARYESLYGENRPSGLPRREYYDSFARRCSAALARYKLPMLMPHGIYKNRFALYDEVFILLSHMKVLYRAKGVDVTALESSLIAYKAWLQSRKKRFNRNRGESFETLEASLRFLCQSGELESLLKNEKLTEFLEAVIMERKTLDYNSLKLF